MEASLFHRKSAKQRGFWADFSVNILLISSLSLAIASFAAAAQEPSAPKPAQAPPGMGVATGGAHPAVKDSHSRPITAGAFVHAPPIVFPPIPKPPASHKFLNRSAT